MAWPVPESLWLFGGLACYAGGTVVAWRPPRRGGRGRWVLWATLAGAALLGAAVAVRWTRTGYGPFGTLFEVLLSNLFTLGLVCGLLYWTLPLARRGAVVVLPVLLMLGIWALNEPADARGLPATYQSAWLWVHVGVGKLFLGACLTALGLAGAASLDRTRLRASAAPAADEAALDELVWRLMAAAFVFHGLMLIAGAVWAQDAWGRFWAWDPLETWALLTWLVLGAALHLRLGFRVSRVAGWWLVLVVFVLAFVTFFGVPFLSLAPHKGIV